MQQTTVVGSKTKSKLSYDRICRVARKHCKIIDAHRSQCITPTALYNTNKDCFVVLKNPACRFNTVSLPCDALEELDAGIHWLVLYLNDSLYLVDRTDCSRLQQQRQPDGSSSCVQHRKIVDGSVLLELKNLIRLPTSDEDSESQSSSSSEEEEEIEEIDEDDGCASLSVSRLSISSSGSGSSNNNSNISLSRSSESIIIDTRRERHPYTQNHYQTHRYDDEVMAKTAQKYQTRTLIPYSLFSLPQYLMCEGDGRIGCGNAIDDDDDYVRRDTVSEYIQYIYDYALIYSHFKNADHRALLENKLLNYYAIHSDAQRQPDESPHMLMAHCMLNMAHCESSDTQPVTLFDKSSNIKHCAIQDVRCRAMDECVAWELFKLRRAASPVTPDKFAELVQRHRRYMYEMRQEYDVPLPVWLSYTIADHRSSNQPVFWISTPLNNNNNTTTQRESDVAYIVAFEWASLLYEMAASSPTMTAIDATGVLGASTGITFNHGRITLSYTVFRDVFLPLLYKQTLVDSFRLAIILRCQIAPHLTRPIFKSWRMYGWFRDDIYNYLPNPMGGGGSNGSSSMLHSSLPNGRGYANDMYQYCLQHCNLDSPVLRKLTKRDNYMELDDPEGQARKRKLEAERTSIASQMQNVSRLVDIEDLSNYLPPCLSGILEPDFYRRHVDRLGSVSYLIDMGYQQEQVVTHLRANRREEMTTYYKGQAIKKRSAHEQPISLSCNGQFSMDASHGGTARCPYEAKCNGVEKKKRDDYGKVNERMKIYGEFRDQCAKELGGGVSINHPIEYVLHKLKMRNGSVNSNSIRK